MWHILAFAVTGKVSPLYLLPTKSLTVIPDLVIYAAGCIPNVISHVSRTAYFPWKCCRLGIPLTKDTRLSIILSRPELLVPFSNGASGIVYANGALSCVCEPEARYAIPGILDPVPLTYVLGAVVAAELALWRFATIRWDHLTHLTAGAYGIFYYHYGFQVWTSVRDNVNRLVDSESRRGSWSQNIWKFS
jgi:hypothetical protein